MVTLLSQPKAVVNISVYVPATLNVCVPNVNVWLSQIVAVVVSEIGGGGLTDVCPKKPAKPGPETTSTITVLVPGCHPSQKDTDTIPAAL